MRHSVWSCKVTANTFFWNTVSVFDAITARLNGHSEALILAEFQRGLHRLLGAVRTPTSCKWHSQHQGGSTHSRDILAAAAGEDIVLCQWFTHIGWERLHIYFFCDLRTCRTIFFFSNALEFCVCGSECAYAHGRDDRTVYVNTFW